jgi:leucine dehydrogenase
MALRGREGQDWFMQSLIASWDGEEVVLRHDPSTGAWIVIAIHSTRLGPAVGGTRMKSYPHLDDAVRDALRLSRGMSLKWAAAGLARGGGKAVIAVPPGLDPAARTGLLRRFGGLVGQLGGLFMTGPDSGTTEQDMVIISEQGAPFVHCLPTDAGGAGDPADFTARGVMTALELTAERLFGGTLAGRRVLVQGLGSVGRRLTRHLLDAGAELAFSDVSPEAIALGEQLGIPFVAPADLWATQCDLFAPCALGAVLDERTIPQLRCAGIAGAANNQLATPADMGRLAARGILYAPDFVANCGGAVGVMAVDEGGATRDEALEQVADCVRTNLGLVFDRAQGGDTDAAATALARSRLGQAGTDVST